MSALYRVLAATDLPGSDIDAKEARTYAEAEHQAAKYNAVAFTYVPAHGRVYLKNAVPEFKPAPPGLVCFSGVRTSPYDVLTNTDLLGSDIGAERALTLYEAEAAAVRANAHAFTWVPSRQQVYIKGAEPAYSPSPAGLYCISGVRHADFAGKNGGYHILGNTDLPGRDVGEAPARDIHEAQIAAARVECAAFTFVQKWGKVFFKGSVPAATQGPPDTYCVSGVRHGEMF